MPRYIELSGRTFGLWKVLGLAHAGRNTSWHCECQCGKKSVIRGSVLLRGKSMSCCSCSPKVKKHGMYGTPTYRVWSGMICRCADATREYYGSRGIKVCDRWRSFECFLKDMGERPQGKSLDRIDNDGDYEPGNCRWADAITQHNNKRNNVVLEYMGRLQTVPEWSRELGIPQTLIRNRVRSGWSTERALQTTMGKRHRKPDVEPVPLTPGC